MYMNLFVKTHVWRVGVWLFLKAWAWWVVVGSKPMDPKTFLFIFYILYLFIYIYLFIYYYYIPYFFYISNIFFISNLN
jgi:hypothetical protein